MKDYIYKKK